MFPSTGSSIAKSFKGGATKCSYLSSFGLFPYFHEQLVDRIHDAVYAPCYSVLFDECMNKISQYELMDFIVRYWHSDTGQVNVRYLGSEFLGHATAASLLKHFKNGIRQLDPKRLLQVSMDGPSVNWKVYTDLARECKTQELPELLNIGSWKVMETV